VEINGTAIVWDRDYEVVDQWGSYLERMSPTVASQVLKGNLDCRLLVDHEPSKLLARTSSGTLKLSEGPNGLNMTAVLDTRDTDAANTVIRLERRDLSAMSCQFVVDQDEWSEDYSHRTIRSFSRLLDVSCVTYPCSPTTSVAVAQRMLLEAGEAELRRGRTLSKENAAHIKAAHASLDTVLKNAGEQPLATVAGVDGTQNGPSTSPAAAQDGTGSRKKSRSVLLLERDLNELRRPPGKAGKRKKNRSAAALALDLERLRYRTPGKRLKDTKHVKSVRSVAELRALRELKEAT
jgi:HK97 family phage prohead protease